MKMTNACIICGLRKGLPNDHTKCSKELKKIKGASGEIRRQKKLNKNNDSFADYFNGKDKS